MSTTKKHNTKVDKPNHKAKTRRSPTQIELETMAGLYRGGWSQAQIAELTGFSQGCISKKLREYNPMSKRIPDEKRAEIVKLIEVDGLSYRKTAIKMQCGYSTVCRIVAEHRKSKPKVGEIVVPVPTLTNVTPLHNAYVAPEADQAPEVEPVQNKSNKLGIGALVAVVLLGLGLIVFAAQ